MFKRALQSKWFHTLLGLLVSLGLVVWIAQVVDWGEVGNHMVGFDYWYFVPVLLLWFVHFSLRALRWRYLLESGREIPLIKLFDGIMLGNFGNYVLPLRAGEFIRPLLVSRDSHQSFVSCFVSVVIERFFDLVMVLISFGVMVFYLPAMDQMVYQGAAGLSVLAAAIFLFIVLSILLPTELQRLVDFCLRPWPAVVAVPARKFLVDFLSGSRVLRNKVNFWNVTLLSILIWAVNFLIYYVWCLGFGMQADMWYGVALTVILALAVAAPSAPGFAGVYEAGCIVAFRLFDVGASLATSYALITHVFQYAFILAYGGWILFKYGLKFKELRRSGELTKTCP
ncbi:MAG: flippase-like domain-containing protein [Deltaproteobacteria bacterium]|nr:flippase-like domain-containing protein [Deltaproteobacteria bacterium]